MAQITPNLSSSPLDKYRQLALFDWKKIKVFVFSQEFVDVETQISDEIQRYPEFFENNFETPTLDEVRRRTVRKFFAIHRINVFKELNTRCKKIAELRLIQSLDPSTAIMRSINFGLYLSPIEYLGTERHQHFVEKIKRGEFIDSYAVTEIGHGSNTKAIRTTATYCIQREQFVLNTPNFEAAKCWIGFLGHTATHALVFAQLTTPDGIKRGVHIFIVPVRDPLTLLSYPGVTIIDMGEKIGYNGCDNGVIMFKNYRIPRENLLNKHADVTRDGTYTVQIKDTNQLHQASLVSLLTGRVEVCFYNIFFLADALTIAIRYSAVRKQFGICNGDEYQTLQFRLLPYLAANFCFAIVTNYLNNYDFYGDGGNVSNIIAAELHGISSALKPLTGWIAKDGIQECLEACGEHGHLKAARLVDLRNDQDALCTYEGDNHVIFQQTSSWLLKLWPSILKGEQINTPFKSLELLNNIGAIANEKFVANSVEEMTDPKTILKAYRWLVFYSLKRYFEKYQALLENTKNSIVAKNNSQVYIANELATVYIENFILVKTLDKIMESNDYQIKIVLTKLVSLYGLWSLQKHISTLYTGGYTTGPTVGTLLQDGISKLCSDLKNDAISLIDVIAPPDSLLNSVLGFSDGQVYKHLEAAMMQMPIALRWKQIFYWKDHVKPKL